MVQIGDPSLCLYVCGPPCSGKSSLTQALLDTVHVTTTITGDPFWVQNKGRPFPQRVAATNARILEALAATAPGVTLVEWVPWQGDFVSALAELAHSRGDRFLQIALTADACILRQRKLARDGNADLGVTPPPVGISDPATLWFDTGSVPIDQIVTNVADSLNRDSSSVAQDPEP